MSGPGPTGQVSAYRRLRTTVRVGLTGLMDRALLSGSARRVLNTVYNHSPEFVLAAAGYVMRQPPSPMTWEVILSNDRRIGIPVAPGETRTWDLARSYSLAEPQMNALERVVGRNMGRGVAVIDVGSNIGMRSLWALSEGRPVLMFEPNENLHKVVYDTANENNWQRPCIENACVGDKEGLVDFYVAPSGYLSSLDKWMAEREAGTRKIQARMVTIDGYRKRSSNWKDVGYMKIDIEGGEYPALLGARETLITSRPLVVMEMLRGQPDRQRITGFMTALGYAGHRVDVTRFGRLHLRRLLDDGGAGDSANYLFVHEASVPTYLKKFMVK